MTPGTRRARSIPWRELSPRVLRSRLSAREDPVGFECQRPRHTIELACETRPGRSADHVEIWVRREELSRWSGRSALARLLQDTLEQAERRAFDFHHRGGVLRLEAGRPALMGVVNVTPDSFSDGGRFAAVDRAVEHARLLVEQGAAVLDIGGESTRPGSDPVSEEEEMERVLPVLRELSRSPGVPVSVDTRRARVALAALKTGAHIVNDTAALRDDPELASVVRELGAGLILMHRQGTPRTMQDAPHYEHCVAEVTEFLEARAAAAQEAGIPAGHISLDPGIGFGKRLADNLALLRGLGELRSLGFPLLLGASRKSFLGQLTGRDVNGREAATLATTAVARAAGCAWVRVHDVAASRDLLRVLDATDDG